MDKQKFHSMVGAAFIAAVMAILSQFTIPGGAVSMTLQTFVCALAGGLLGSRWGAVSILVWLLLGLLGIPVLTMGKAGPGIFLSPVGGYYIGFIIMAGLSGFRPAVKGYFIRQFLLALAGLLICYALGTIWFMGYFSLGLGKEMPLWMALTMTVFPFVIFDLIKVSVGIFCGVRIRNALVQSGLLSER